MICEHCRQTSPTIGESGRWSPVNGDEENTTVPLFRCDVCGYHQRLR